MSGERLASDDGPNSFLGLTPGEGLENSGVSFPDS